MLAWATSRAARTSGAISSSGLGHVGGRHPEVVDVGAVEARGELAQRDVAALRARRRGAPAPRRWAARPGPAGRGRRPRRSPSTPRRSSRCSTRRGYVGSGSGPKPVPRSGTLAAMRPRRRPAVVAVHRARRPHRARHRRSPTGTRARRARTWPPTSTRSSATCRRPRAGSRRCSIASLSRRRRDEGAPGERPRLARSGGGSRRRRDRRRRRARALRSGADRSHRIDGRNDVTEP